MKKKLTDNLGLKIGSILFAGILWLLVTNITNPSQKVGFNNVPVKIINTDLITSQGKVFNVLEGSDVIDTVNVWLPRSVSGSLRDENIVAIADMKNLTNVNTIQIELSTNRYSESIDSIVGSSDVVKLNIEDKKSISIPLKATTSGTLQEGYIVGNVSTDQNLVRVTGPESVISQIKSAAVNVGIAGFTSDIGTDAEVKLYDGEGNEVSKSNLTLNINSVGVKVEILTTKSVPLKFNSLGVPAEGYRATGVISSSPDAVLLAGKSNVLKNLSVIEVPDTALVITGATEDVTVTVDINEYIPGSVDLADNGFDGNVTVTAFIEPEIIRTIPMSENDIVIQNMPEGYEGRVSAYEEEFYIQIRGLAEDVNNIDAAQLIGSIDMNQLLESGIIETLEEGYYDVNLSFNLPETVALRENITVRLHIKEK